MSLFHSISSFDGPSHFEDIANYYEKLVMARLTELKESFDTDQLADIACLALNQLPSWYIRNHVDASSYLSETQVADLVLNTDRAIAFAVEKVASSSRE